MPRCGRALIVRDGARCRHLFHICLYMPDRHVYRLLPSAFDLVSRK